MVERKSTQDPSKTVWSDCVGDTCEKRFKLSDVLSGKTILCDICQREYYATDRQITINTYAMQCKLINCNCGLLGVVAYNNEHQCENIESRFNRPHGHVINTCCDMNISYWMKYSHTDKDKDMDRKILHNIPLLCKYTMWYNTHTHKLCDKCSTHVHYCTLGRPTFLRTEISNK